MKEQTKSFAFIALVGALFISFGITLVSGSSIIAADAVCLHEGNHYTELSPTASTSGTHEYWACCKCHEHFINYVSGTWNENGQASTVSVDDDRYLYPINDLLVELEERGFSADLNDDGTSYTITGYDNSSTTVVIPEGVTGIKSGTFMGNKMQWIVIPTTVRDGDIKGMIKTGAKNVTLFFTGDTTYTASALRCKAIYKIVDEGWKWVDETPTPINNSR